MPYAISTEERVNAYTQSRQSAPQTIGLPDGGYLTVWSGSGQADLGYGVYLQRFDAAGGRVGSELLVNTTTVYSQQNPAVTVLASGGWVVTWDSIVPSGQPGDPAAIGVFTQLFSAAGARIGTETQVSGAGYSQQVAALPDGGYVVTWTQQLDYPWSSVMVRRYDASGQAQGPAQVLDQDLDASYASVVATDAGLIAVWRASNDGGAATIAIQALDTQGGRLGDPIHIPRDGDRTYPEIVALIDGGFALVWLEAGGLYGRILGDGGQPVGERFLIEPAAGGQLLHAVVATPDGGFTVAWDRFSGGGSHILEARAFFADGRPNGETIRIRDAAGSPGEPPALTTLASGEVVLTYARYVGDLTDYFDVFQVRLNPLTVTQRGTLADDALTGGTGGDRLMGLDGADLLLGMDGDDFLVGGGGNDILDGGAGRDEAVFAGSWADYTIFEAGGGYRVKGADGFDQLIGIEVLRFDDRVIDLLRIVCDPSTGAASPDDAAPTVSPVEGRAPPKPSAPPVFPLQETSGEDEPVPLVLPGDLHDDALPLLRDPRPGPAADPFALTEASGAPPGWFLFDPGEPTAAAPWTTDPGVEPSSWQGWGW